jgi:hypothetical protein
MSAAERAGRKCRQPCRHRERRDADDEMATAVSALECIGAHGGERDRERGEEDAQRVTLHAPNLLPFPSSFGPETRWVHWPTGTGA